MSHQRDFERAMKGWAIARIIGTLLPVLLVGYLFISCKVEQGRYEREKEQRLQQEAQARQRLLGL
jgi:hypothetical protein